jgi:hypothetical protein
MSGFSALLGRVSMIGATLGSTYKNWVLYRIANDKKDNGWKHQNQREHSVVNMHAWLNNSGGSGNREEFCASFKCLAFERLFAAPEQTDLLIGFGITPDNNLRPHAWVNALELRLN